MSVYGRLSRLTSNPTPRQYEPEYPPLFDPSKPLRFCEYGSHWCSEPAPDPKQLGCPEHRSVKWRSKYKPGNKGTVITERWCKGCNAFRSREQFANTPKTSVRIVAECNDCVARRAPVVNPVKLKRCGGCNQSYPLTEFATYTGASGQKDYSERCSKCYKGPRKIFAPDSARDERIIQQFLEGKPQRLIADFNEVSRGYVVRIITAYRATEQAA